MNAKLILGTIFVAALTGCASVPTESTEKSDEAKKFATPPSGTAGVYIYRSGGFGTALKKDIWIDDKCVGESAPNTFFHEVVKGDEEHTVATESEFSPNTLKLKTDSGKNYFIQQYIKMGVFVGGAGLKVIDEEKAKAEILKLKLAKPGTCSS